MKTVRPAGLMPRHAALLLFFTVLLALLAGPLAFAQSPAEVIPLPDPEVSVAALEPTAAEPAAVAGPAAAAYDHGDVAWMLTSTLLVLLMVVPGLALFYGGMVRSKNVLSVLMQVLVVYSVVVLVWVATATARPSVPAMPSSARSPSVPSCAASPPIRWPTACLNSCLSPSSPPLPASPPRW
jgi:Ammonia permease